MLTIKNHTHILLFACLLFLATACAPASDSPGTPTGSSLSLQDCQLSASGLPIRLPARCGRLTVFEDRENNSGRQIELNIAVIPAVSRNPAPDPLFFLTGGPGQAATESYLQVSYAFDRINQKRDIVLVDQRGTGKSNPLNCTEIESEESAGDLDLPDEDEELSQQLNDCLAGLDADPTLYTTSIAMQDLDEVRAALGYNQINLYGVSYGTRAVLTYLQQYPTRVRSIVLDGVVPQDSALGLDVARDAQRALDLIFARCAAEAECSQAFPNLHPEFKEILADLSQSPVELTLAHPTTGEIVQETLTHEKFVSAVRLLTYTPETAALIPLLIHTAHAQADYSLLAAQYLIVADQLVSSISYGMNFSILCSEDLPFITPAEAEQANTDTYMENMQTDQLFKICAEWPQGEVPADFKQPVRSAVSALILSGEVDPVTPPQNGERVTQTLSNSLHLVVPGQGHNVIIRGCIPRIVTNFIESGSVQGLETACVQAIKAMPFFVNFAGPVEMP